jgi:MSHA pilin protein MshD
MNVSRPSRFRRRGLTLFEAVCACLVVSILMVSAMRAAGITAKYQFATADRARARFLANQLMTDILSTSYQDPNVTPLFGVEAGETTSSKVNYDDVDDFNGWTESPPQDRDGNAMTELTGWQRSVSVAWVSTTNLSSISSSETGVKRITVTVSKNGATLATRVAIKVNAP